jgi:cobalamin synthase
MPSANMKTPKLPRVWVWFARIGWVSTALLYFPNWGFSQGIKNVLVAALAVFFVMACLD